VLIGTYSDYGQFKTAVTRIAPTQGNRVIVFVQQGSTTFQVGAVVGRQNIMSMTFASAVVGFITGNFGTKPSTFDADFPDAVQADSISLT
jgi:hypothetical protein